jgi:hypothetical protein
MIAAPVLTATVYAEHSKGKAKEWCPDYGGKWKNDKCQIKDSEDRADYEDVIVIINIMSKNTQKYAIPDYYIFQKFFFLINNENPVEPVLVAVLKESSTIVT